jgi:hypothetical protein
MCATLASVTVVATGCASSPETQSNAVKQSVSPQSTPTTTNPADDPTPTVTSKSPRAPDPIAAEYTPVQRNGAVPTPHIKAQREPFDKPVAYPDRVSLVISSIRQGVTGGSGPGSLPGRPMTTMKIRFTNDSAKPIDLNAVVVTVTYGAAGGTRRVAPPVYEDDSTDFFDTLMHGESKVATYSFSIPTGSLENVTMYVDFDGVHAAATFGGSVK